MNPGSFPNYHLFGYAFFFKTFAQLQREYVVDRREFFKNHNGLVFSNLVFSLNVVFNVLVYTCLWLLRVQLISFSSFVISVMIFMFPCFTPKLFYLLCIRLLVSFRAFATNSVAFSLVILEYPVFFCIVRFCFGIYWASLLSLISFDLFIRVVLPELSAVVFFFFFVFSSQYILVCFSFLSTFDYCRSFFTCLSSQIFRPGFLFLFEYP